LLFLLVFQLLKLFNIFLVTISQLTCKYKYSQYNSRPTFFLRFRRFRHFCPIVGPSIRHNPRADNFAQNRIPSVWADSFGRISLCPLFLVSCPNSEPSVDGIQGHNFWSTKSHNKFGCHFLLCANMLTCDHGPTFQWNSALHGFITHCLVTLIYLSSKNRAKIIKISNLYFSIRVKTILTQSIKLYLSNFHKHFSQFNSHTIGFSNAMHIRERTVGSEPGTFVELLVVMESFRRISFLTLHSIRRKWNPVPHVLEQVLQGPDTQ
jgi:hypothetical protein